jgi:hypothetical protein
MKQLSLVACYGTKSAAFGGLLADCIDLIRQSALSPLFRPYAIEQMHMTIVGMERVPELAGLVNANIHSRRGDCIPMNFNALQATLMGHLPLTVRFGGFGSNDVSILSAGRPLFERSFQVQWPTRRCTLIGWPHRHSDFSGRGLNRLRDALESECGLGHKYPDDNDVFLVLGSLAPPETAPASEMRKLRLAAARAEARIRARLASQPVDLELTLDDLRIVAYEDARLPFETTASVSLAEAAALGAEWIGQLYD